MAVKTALKIRGRWNCGGGIRTLDLWVMSPTSYQLLHPASSRIQQKLNIHPVMGAVNGDPLLFLGKARDGREEGGIGVGKRQVFPIAGGA